MVGGAEALTAASEPAVVLGGRLAAGSLSLEPSAAMNEPRPRGLLLHALPVSAGTRLSCTGWSHICSVIRSCSAMAWMYSSASVESLSAMATLLNRRVLAALQVPYWAPAAVRQCSRRCTLGLLPSVPSSSRLTSANTIRFRSSSFSESSA